MIEQHYDDEVLIGILQEEAAADLHLPACENCAGAFESYRDLTSALGDGSVWDEREVSEDPVPRTTETLRSFAAAAKAEDAEAGPIVARLLAATSSERAALMQRHPECRTAGLVRKLLRQVDTINFTDPKGAVEWSAMAAEIARSLEPSRYPKDAVEKLRATASREYAFALYYVGSFPEAVAALDRADAHMAGCMVSECDGAEVQVLRARVYRDLEKFDQAIELARNSASVFRAYGNRRRAALAEAIEAAVLVRLQRFTDALAIESRIASDSSVDEESRACALTRAAYCYRELSAFEEAKDRYVEAMVVFERLGLTTRRSIARWGLARVLLDEGRHEPALAMFNELRGEFEELGLGHDLALVSLDAVETLLALNRPAAVAELCRAAMRYFGKVGLAYSMSAMTALAYLREAAERGTLVPAAVHRVRTYFEQLPKQPHLQFAYSE